MPICFQDFVVGILAQDPYGVAMMYLKYVDVGIAEGGVTNPRVIEWGDELQLMLRHRMGKKTILEHAIVRLQEGCVEAEEEGKQQTPKEARFLGSCSEG